MNEKNRDEKAAATLMSLVGSVPGVKKLRRYHRTRKGSRISGLEVHFGAGRAQRWIVEAHPRALRPRDAELAALGLSIYVSEGIGDYAVVVAPYVSPRSSDILAREGVGFLDSSGNCRLISGPLFIERAGHANVQVQRAEQRSLLTPGAERVLRALLDPQHQQHPWTVRELARAAFPGVSVGQAHKVVKLLEQQAFVRRAKDGLVLVDAKKLLEEWSANYRSRRNKATRYYSPQSPGELRGAFSAVANWDAKNEMRGVLASFTAAEVLAPAVRQHRFFVYWAGDRDPLIERLQLKPVESGENVVVYEPYDNGVFYPAPQVPEPVTCPVQTYLDLRASPTRGEEAAVAVFDRYLREAYQR